MTVRSSTQISDATNIGQHTSLWNMLFFTLLCLSACDLSFALSASKCGIRLQPSRLSASKDGVSVSSQRTQKGTSSIVKDFQGIKRNVVGFLRESNYQGAKEMIRGMLDYLQESSVVPAEEKLQLSKVVDETFDVFYCNTFAPPFRGKTAESRVSIGASTLHLQLTSEVLISPYNELPRRTLLNALKALTAVNESKGSFNVDGLSNTDEAFRILQRLVTGVGVRNGNTKQSRLQESDFNLVLNAYSNVGRMDMAHRVVALQERTPHAPSLSPVTYSILLKGYGRLRDFDNIQMLLMNAQRCELEPDIIMLNSLIDAYVNCNEVGRAKDIFSMMKNPKNQSNPEVSRLLANCPAPNHRTYNIMLKGLARSGDLDDSIQLANEMKHRNIWDHVTTNTLVQAAVNAGDFAFAEKILEEHTEIKQDVGARHHRNAEAYTTLIDGYAKEGDIKKGVALLKLMKERFVQPNEFTYTCLIGALARGKNIEQAKKMLWYMHSEGLKVKTVTYNSLITGLAYRNKSLSDDEYDRYVDAAVGVLRDMIKRRARPNAVTISIILGAFGKCERSRVAEAVALVARLDSDGYVSKSNIMIATSLIQLHGLDRNLEGALETFRRIQRPDVAAINALVHAALRCDNETAATKIFHRYFDIETKSLRPDVTSFSIFIKYFLERNSREGTISARSFYEDMKYKRQILPDTALVDIILKAMIENGRARALHASEVRFVAGVLRDAKKLQWGEGQLEKRRLSLNMVMTGRTADAWEEEAGLFGLTESDSTQDAMFKDHGWNKVDSGFQLWGAGKLSGSPNGSSDVFLKSKGWNSVESGFRII